MSTTAPDLDRPTARYVAELAVALAEPKTVNGTTHLVVPPGWSVTDLTDKIEKAAAAPNRCKGTLQALTIGAFVDLVGRHKRPACMVYADVEKCLLTAVLNDQDNTTEPNWRDHRVTYQAEFSKEFGIWRSHDRKAMTQEEFAVFLEDNIADVVEPSGDVLLKVALTLEAKSSADFKSSRRLDNGQVQLTYVEQINATAGGEGSVEIPREFSIGCRLFKGGEGFKIKARLKYRLGGGTVKFWYELDRPERAIEEAFGGVMSYVLDAEMPMVNGRP